MVLGCMPSLFHQAFKPLLRIINHPKAYQHVLQIRRTQEQQIQRGMFNYDTIDFNVSQIIIYVFHT